MARLAARPARLFANPVLIYNIILMTNLYRLCQILAILPGSRCWISPNPYNTFFLFIDINIINIRVGKEPSGPSREPSHILLPLARLVGIWSWRAEPRASHYKGSARLAVKPPRLARSRLARTARRAYMCNIHFVRFS